MHMQQHSACEHGRRRAVAPHGTLAPSPPAGVCSCACLVAASTAAACAFFAAALAAALAAASSAAFLAAAAAAAAAAAEAAGGAAAAALPPALGATGAWAAGWVAPPSTSVSGFLPPAPPPDWLLLPCTASVLPRPPLCADPLPAGRGLGAKGRMAARATQQRLQRDAQRQLGVTAEACGAARSRTALDRRASQLAACGSYAGSTAERARSSAAEQQQLTCASLLLRRRRAAQLRQLHARRCRLRPQPGVLLLNGAALLGGQSLQNLAGSLRRRRRRRRVRHWAAAVQQHSDVHVQPAALAAKACMHGPPAVRSSPAFHQAAAPRQMAAGTATGPLGPQTNLAQARILLSQTPGLIIPCKRSGGLQRQSGCRTVLRSAHRTQKRRRRPRTVRARRRWDCMRRLQGVAMCTASRQPVQHMARTAAAAGAGQQQAARAGGGAGGTWRAPRRQGLQWGASERALAPARGQEAGSRGQGPGGCGWSG